MYETESSAIPPADVDAVPMANVGVHGPAPLVHGLPPSSDGAQRNQNDPETAAGPGRRTPDPAAGSSPAVAVVSGSRRSKWGKLRQTVKATTMFASTVSVDAGSGGGPAAAASTRGAVARRNHVDDDRRDSFLKRFSTRQSSYGSSCLQAAAAAAGAVETPTSNADSAQPDGKVRPPRCD